jgi:PLP dependent protein
MYLYQILDELREAGAKLVAVTKNHPVEDILDLYRLGLRDFGENRVQEMAPKWEALPRDIRWHAIGHLQTNKVKYIAPFVHMIHSVYSLKLLQEIDKQAERAGRIIPCLLQVHIAKEETKFGLDRQELLDLLADPATKTLKWISIQGLMGMATFTDNAEQVRAEFAGLRQLFEEVKARFFAQDEAFRERSMGMSGDYKIALEEGSTIVRIGSLLFPIAPSEPSGG